MKTCEYPAGLGARQFWRLTIFCLLAVGISARADSNPKTAARSPAPETGVASYYADKYHGRPTASGEIFNMYQFTAAHPSLKFGTVVKVTDTVTGRAVVVRINDRGPFTGGRVIDLSLAAARELQMVRSGLAAVKIEILRN